MALNEQIIKKAIKFVKKEPRTIQEISKVINKSWVTTDSYIKQIKDRTGQINIKTFRKGTRGALKLVYYNYSESLDADNVKERLFSMIRHGRKKQDFDFMEIFQFIEDKKKKCFLEEYEDEYVAKKQNIMQLFHEAENVVYVLSGNLSFINLREKNDKMIDIVEDLLKRKVRLKIMTRVNVASVSNINKLAHLIQRYPEQIEIKHSYQPLRGFIIDDKIARFKDEEQISTYRKGELNKNTRIFYEFYDHKWISWLQKVFWNLFRSSIDYDIRLKEIKKYF